MMININHDLLSTLAIHGTINLGKLFVLAVWTGKTKRAVKAFDNKEDAGYMGVQPRVSEEVERVRRVHRNELENVVPFLGLGFIYCCSGACPVMVTWHFRIYTMARIIYCLAYLNESRLGRGVGFASGLLVCISMTVQNAFKFNSFF